MGANVEGEVKIPLKDYLKMRDLSKRVQAEIGIEYAVEYAKWTINGGVNGDRYEADIDDEFHLTVVRR